MISSIMSNGLTGLLNHQRAIRITSNNIANANTEGYSKQRVNFATNPAINNGRFSIGTGVHTQSITRMHDEMLWSNVKTSSALSNKSNEFAGHMNQVKENLVGQGLDGNNITNMVDGWFSKLQDLADNPNSDAVKQDLRISGEAILERSSMLTGALTDYKNTLVEQRKLLVNEADSYLSQLDDITNRIRMVEAGNENSGNKDYANELRDRRDLLEKKLNDIGDFQTFKDNISKTGYNNVTDWGLKYNYNFSEGGGRLAGLDDAIEAIDSITGKFDESIGPFSGKITEFLNGDMDNPNELIQWNYDNNPSKQIGDEFVSFSSEVDAANSLAESASVSANTFQEKYDSLTKVNLDEEMMNMMMYQRVYEANAKVIQTADEMLGTIINIKS